MKTIKIKNNELAIEFKKKIKKNSRKKFIKKSIKHIEKNHNNIGLVFLLDHTASTRKIVEAFRKKVTTIHQSLIEIFSHRHQLNIFFGRYYGSGEVNIGGAGDISEMSGENKAGDSMITKVLNRGIVKTDIFSSSKNNFVFILGDELGTSCQDDVDSVVSYFYEKKVYVFFLWEPGGCFNDNKEEITELFIDIIGDRAFLLDFSNVDVEELVKIVEGCIEYIVSLKVEHKKLTLSHHLKGIGVDSPLMITNGGK